jgi:hypothetical protein
MVIDKVAVEKVGVDKKLPEINVVNKRWHS